jgi:hypothetical protein
VLLLFYYLYSKNAKIKEVAEANLFMFNLLHPATTELFSAADQRHSIEIR